MQWQIFVLRSRQFTFWTCCHQVSFICVFNTCEAYTSTPTEPLKPSSIPRNSIVVEIPFEINLSVQSYHMKWISIGIFQLVGIHWFTQWRQILIFYFQRLSGLFSMAGYNTIFRYLHRFFFHFFSILFSFVAWTNLCHISFERKFIFTKKASKAKWRGNEFTTSCITKGRRESDKWKKRQRGAVPSGVEDGMWKGSIGLCAFEPPNGKSFSYRLKNTVRKWRV